MRKKTISGGDAHCTRVDDLSTDRAEVWLNEETGVMEPFVRMEDQLPSGLVDLRVFGAEYRPRRKRRLGRLQVMMLFVLAVMLLVSSFAYTLTWWLFR